MSEVTYELEDRIRRAEERVAREQSQFQQQSVQTAISMGATVLGALFGRKLASAGTIGRATTAARGAGRAMREHEDVATASLLENFIDEAEKRCWFLFEASRAAERTGH